LLGTVDLLEEKERKRVKGLIINKFRGDKSILDPGIMMLEERGKIPVVGVTPYMDVDVEDEDSLSERLESSKTIGIVDIAVIRLPRISNFTDFNIFETMEGVSLRYVSKVSEMRDPDMIILPGSKSTIHDLLFLRNSGLEGLILKMHERGKVIFGICGGYQMLGRTLQDPHGVEGGGTVKGLGLLDMDTIFNQEKTRRKVKGSFLNLEGTLSCLSDQRVEGYEIHMGISTVDESTSPSPMVRVRDSMKEEDSYLDGSFKENVYGSYIHGIFDQKNIATGIIKALGKRKGLPDHMLENVKGIDLDTYRNTQYDKMAEILREHMDLNYIYEIMK
ncbi:MAG TPA: cobyric acid synthase, partial [Candidatus Merdenecus merdavium]|nr:cobyric acid synthase [Candidatus Merdenecus merdavium]